MVVNQVERKITKIGNSLGVTLPPEVLEHANLKQGDDIRFTLLEDHQVGFKKYTPLKLDVLENIDQDFIDGLANLFKNYDDTLKNLAKR